MNRAIRQNAPFPYAELACVVAIGISGVVFAHLDLPLLQSLIAQALILCFLAFGIGYLIRMTGLVSFGHAAPFGIGAYGIALSFSGSGVAPELMLLLIVPGVTLLYFLVGLVVSRLEGIGFAMLTLALGQGVYVAATKFRAITGGSDGIAVSLPRRLFGLPTDILQQPHGMLVAALIILLIVYVILRFFERSHLGRLAIAIRENEERANFLGYRTRALRAAVYGVSCGIASLGGIAFGIYQGFVSPDVLTWGMSGSGLIMAILGGSSFLWGPIVGALVFFFTREWLTEFTSHWLAILGLTLIVVMVLWPKGISGGVEHLLTRRRAPSKPASAELQRNAA
ncbi:branched-chain amino acid ABC transporter permease [Microvirga guangxiensis]|uniref:Branched-chain amino acid transport system permease protein n=1 Tax=Microvirga guangxiensis TaxID=549386 RepID=A0A1G5F2B4_9HYPH|nr:branched-chain amino acid ABC transporter permease [Microvirga guangxiensis]SCY33040.1 branched-chain amino acid transport system permease protein [Microvirga guangxiensis]